MKRVTSLLVILTTVIVSYAQGGTSSWSIYPAYGSIEQVEPTGKDVFVLATNNLFSYNPDDTSITTYDKTNYLNDSDIKFIGWNDKVKRLLIAYENSDIDLLSINGDVINVPDLYLKNISGLKHINSITMMGEYAYLATGFGIMKVNMSNGQIADTYIMKYEAIQVAVNSTHIMVRNKLNEIYYASLSKNLLDQGQWTYLSGKNYDFLFTVGNKFVALRNNRQPEWIDPTTGSTTPFGSTMAFAWAKKSGDRVICGHSNYFHFINADATTQTYTGQNYEFSLIAYDSNKNLYWANDASGKLTAYSFVDGMMAQKTSGVTPDGPISNDFYRLTFAHDRLYATAGLYNVTTYSFADGLVHLFKDNTWSQLPGNLMELTGHRYKDACSVVVDPDDEGHIFVGAETGLYEFRNFQFYKDLTNWNDSPLVSNDPNSQNWKLVLSLAFDSKNERIWVFNSENSNMVAYNYKSETWDVRPHPKELSETRNGIKNCLESGIIDSRGLIWFCSTRWDYSRVFCYNPDTDVLKRYDNFVNQDGTSYQPSLYMLTEDKEGNIWIATEKGPFYITSKDIKEGNNIMTQHKVPRNDGTNLADYLLADVQIRAITVDAANRKWIAAPGVGLYLISSDNNEQIHNFTPENSELLSTGITSIAIDDKTGRVFFATDKGLCSYQSDATESNEDMDKNDVWAYPNPVTPDYTGDISIVGLDYNSQITITTASGQVVNQGRSNGGMYTWNGCDLKGRPVASGVYMVCVATSAGKSGVVTKIAIVR